jgi:hypothetical protein
MIALSFNGSDVIGVNQRENALSIDFMVEKMIENDVSMYNLQP